MTITNERARIERGMPDTQYFAQTDFLNRSTAFSVYAGGGIVQEFLADGGKLFAGNAGTDLGTRADMVFQSVAAGSTVEHAMSSLFSTPPAEVLSKSGSRAGKAYTDWKLEQGDKPELTDTDREKLMRMVRNFSRNQRAVELLEATEDTQLSVFWEDLNGYKRKARADGVTRSLWYDLKTTSAASMSLVPKSVMAYGYHWQAAWYYAAAMAADWPSGWAMPFIFMQSVPPYTCAVYRLPEGLIVEASQQIDETLRNMRMREELGEYLPEDYGVELEMIVPEWLLKKASA